LSTWGASSVRRDVLQMVGGQSRVAEHGIDNLSCRFGLDCLLDGVWFISTVSLAVSGVVSNRYGW